MKIRKKFIYASIAWTFIGVVVFPIGGCFTRLEINSQKNHGMVKESSTFSGEVYGDTTNIYVQGQQEVYRGKYAGSMMYQGTHPVYRIIKLDNGTIV